MSSSEAGFVRRFVLVWALGSERGVEDVDPPAGEADEGGVVFLAFRAVGSARGAVPVFRPVRLLGPPAEPGVPIAEHRALHKPRWRQVVVQLAGVHGVGIFGFCRRKCGG